MNVKLSVSRGVGGTFAKTGTTNPPHARIPQFCVGGGQELFSEGGQELARGYVLVMWLMKRVIAARGGNGFLQELMLSSGVCAGFCSDSRGEIVRAGVCCATVGSYH